MRQQLRQRRLSAFELHNPLSREDSDDGLSDGAGGQRYGQTAEVDVRALRKRLSELEYIDEDEI
jgi:hypothetical protein